MTRPAEKTIPPPAAPVRIGDRVLVRIGGPDETPELRPGLVVKVHGPDTVNLQVFCDGRADDAICPHLDGQSARGPTGIRWCTSMSRGSGVGQWRTGGEG